MRFIATAFLCLLALPALADTYSVTIAGFTMPAPVPAGSAVRCKAYLGTVAIPGGDRPCGAGAALTFTVPAEGSYSVTYETLNAQGVASPGKSPALAFTVSSSAPPPPNPTQPPSGSFTCVNQTQTTFLCTVKVD